MKFAGKVPVRRTTNNKTTCRLSTTSMRRAQQPRDRRRDDGDQSSTVLPSTTLNVLTSEEKKSEKNYQQSRSSRIFIFSSRSVECRNWLMQLYQRSNQSRRTRATTSLRYILLFLSIVYTTNWLFVITNSSQTSANVNLGGTSSDTTPLSTVTVLGGGWKRISPSRLIPPKRYGDENNDEEDDLLIGRSCQWRPYGVLQGIFRRFVYSPIAIMFLRRRPPISGRWICRDCSHPVAASESLSSSSVYSSWDDCPLLIPRGKCPEFDFQPWDGPRPRSRSASSSSTSTKTINNVPSARLLTSFGVGTPLKLEYEQPQCQHDHHSHHLQRTGWSNRCFDLRRCQISKTQQKGHPSGEEASKSSTTPEFMNIYAHEGRARTDITHAMDKMTKQDEEEITEKTKLKVKMVDDPKDACLLIVHFDDLQRTKTHTNQIWNHGRNHYVYGIVEPIDSRLYLHFDYASVGSIVWTNEHIRLGYDIAVPLPSKWSAPPPLQQDHHRLERNNDNTLTAIDWLDDSLLHRQRKYLMTFQGSIQDTLQPYYQHRWLAAEYLYDHTSNNPDVVIDVQCKHKSIWGDRVLTVPYDDINPKHFDELMTDSTFAFCPGGSQVTSYRFTEVLSVGSIPVITPEIITPFAPELDWTGCVVRVSQSRIVDLVRILRSISPEEIQQRQRECRRLFRFISNDIMLDGTTKYDKEHKSSIPLSSKSDKDQSINSMITTLRIWASRIQIIQSNNEILRSTFG